MPVKDGRKIALVLFGGAMTGVRNAGVCLALIELGLRGAFDEIYASSAGFCNASYFLGGAGPEAAAFYYEVMAGRKFLNFFKLWRVANIPYLIHSMQHIRPLNVNRIMRSNTKLFVRVGNMTKNREELLEAHKFPGKDYFNLMRAAISLPFLSPGSVELGGHGYKDLIFDESMLSMMFDVSHSRNTDVVLAYNSYEQYEYLHSKIPNYFGSKNILEIVPKKQWRLSKLETSPAKLKKACRQMGNLTKELFGSNKPVSLKYRRRRKKKIL